MTAWTNSALPGFRTASCHTGEALQCKRLLACGHEAAVSPLLSGAATKRPSSSYTIAITGACFVLRWSSAMATSRSPVDRAIRIRDCCGESALCRKRRAFVELARASPGNSSPKCGVNGDRILP
jgi:hypothetical protein